MSQTVKTVLLLVGLVALWGVFNWIGNIGDTAATECADDG